MAVSHARKSCWILTFLSLFWGNCGYAAGLGAVSLRSGLGEPLQASVQLFGAGTDELDARCIKVRLESLEGAMVMTPLVAIEHADAAASIRLRTRQAINEPAMNVMVQIDCGTQVRRTYQILLDPVPTAARVAAPQAQPVRLPAHPANMEPAEQLASPRRKAVPEHDAPFRKPSPELRRPQPKHHRTTPKAHPVLRLSAAGATDEELDGVLRLRLADRLTSSTTASDNQNADTPQTAPIRLDTAPDEEHIKMQALMKDLHAEAVALRAEAARMKQQNLAYRNQIDSTHDESLNWIKGLAGLLAVCFAAVGWLLWRVFTMKQAASQPWHDPFTVLHTETLDTELLEGHREAIAQEPYVDEIDDTPTETAAIETESGMQAAKPRQRAEVPAIDELTALAPVFAYPAASNVLESAKHASPEMGHLLKAEEISDVMELVDAWMTLNAPDKVLELLRPFNDVEQPESPLPWLCLLDVYRALGDQTKYDAILLRIKTLFNVKLAPWDAHSSHEPPKTLADFPHVIEEIADLWQTSAILPYLESLLHDDRNGTRHGFDLPAYRDILQLTTLASEPGRLTRHGQAMPDQAHAILFGTREQPLANAFASPIGERIVTSPNAAVAAREKPPIRERPKYITTSYERAIALRQSVKNRADDTATANADPERATTSATAQASALQTATTKAANDLTHDETGAVSLTATPGASEWLNASDHPDDLSPIAIKLHLAIAYQDIGDNEGACLLLDEVIHDGNEEQSQQAKLMLAKLA
jgi:pilus assembly protein FimV